MKQKLTIFGMAFLTLGLLASLTRTEALAQTIKAALTRNVDNPDLHPFQIEIGSDPLVNVRSFPVPAKQRLVIDYVSYQCGSQFPGAIGLATTVGGVGVTHWIQHDSSEGQATTFCITGRQVKIYADPGTTVLYQTNGSIGATDVSISGHLVDVP